MEQFAEPQAPSRVRGVQSRSGPEDEEAESDRLSLPARALLEFSIPRDPAQLAAFINLRVLNPEHAHWRRGIEAAAIYNRLNGDLQVPFTYRVPKRGDQEAQTEGWPTTLAGFPLGQWIADARRFYARGRLDTDRIAQLEKLGMVWSDDDVAWEERLAAARGCAEDRRVSWIPPGGGTQSMRASAPLCARRCWRFSRKPVTWYRQTGPVARCG
ncbi:helicase associated domain-containing protein [Streptomyces sp. NPDC001233]